ncbi:hypothetical protein Tco_1510339 [Tanacetum coccineum]
MITIENTRVLKASSLQRLQFGQLSRLICSSHSMSIGSLRVVAALSEFYFPGAKVLIPAPMLGTDSNTMVYVFSYFM